MGKVTLTERILDKVALFPDRTATQIAHLCELDPATVSGILARQVGVIHPRVRREEVRVRGDKRVWHYFPA